MIRVEGIAKSYRKKQVLSDVSFEAKEGECVGIIGANGCGKSTLLAILAGAVKPDAGAIFYHDREMLKQPKLFYKYAAYVPQENPLLEELTVYENLKLWYPREKWRGGIGHSASALFEEGLPAKFGLSKVQRERVSNLSGGMKKRLNIACALSQEQRILLLDEPGAALDVACKEDIRDYLAKYLEEGKTVILTSHEEMELALCSSLYLVEHGKLMQVEKGFSIREIASLIRKQEEEIGWKK